MGEPYDYRTTNIKYDESMESGGRCGCTGRSFWSRSPYVSIDEGKSYYDCYIKLKNSANNLSIIHETIHSFWNPFNDIFHSYQEGIAVAVNSIVMQELSSSFPNYGFSDDYRQCNVAIDKKEEFTIKKEQKNQTDFFSCKDCENKLGDNSIPLSYDKFHSDSSMEHTYYLLSGRTFYEMYKNNNNIFKSLSSKIFTKINSLNFPQTRNAFSVEELKDFLRQDLSATIDTHDKNWTYLQQDKETFLNSQKVLNPHD